MKIKSTGIDSTISIFFYPSRSLSIALSHSSLRSWLLINFKTFLFFYYFLGNQTEFFTRFFFFFTIFVLISSSRLSPSNWFHQAGTTTFRYSLFPIQTLRLGIFSISLDFVVLKAYFWSVCFCLDSNFVRTLLFALSILNFCGFCSWIWNAMSKLNLWFCVLRAFNVIEFVVLTCWLLCVSAHFGCIIMSFRCLVKNTWSSCPVLLLI